MSELLEAPTFDVSFTEAIAEGDQHAFLADLVASGLSLPQPGQFLGKGAGGEAPAQVWIQLYLDGVVQGAGMVTIGAFVAGVKIAVSKWQARLKATRQQAPAFNVVIVPVVYVVPEEDEATAFDSIGTHYAQRGSSNGDVRWDPERGWEDAEQRWVRKRAETGEDAALAQVEFWFSPAIDEAERGVFDQVLDTAPRVSLRRSAYPIELSVSDHPAELAVTIVLASGLSYLGQSTAKALIALVVRAVRELRAHSVSRGKATPIASIQLGRATYSLPEEQDEIVEIAMLAEQSRQDPPSGARYWDPNFGWKSFDERVGQDDDDPSG